MLVMCDEVVAEEEESIISVDVGVMVGLSDGVMVGG